ncbi:MAG: polymer-forming cytoskeletal protein [Chloroflexota bacterium]|nr:polymer-forming cytoskeletal protein [Chloroflexota bacterium]
MVFRRDNKADSFQRQISALRQQLGTDADAEEEPRPAPETDDEPDEDRGRSGTGFSAYTARDSGFSFGDFGSSPSTAREVEVAPPPPMPSLVADAQTSVVAHDTVWQGELRSEGSIHLHGRFEGLVSAKQDVYVAEEADVDATVTSTNLIVAGTLRGTVRCQGRFEVLPQGRVTADVQAPTLVVHEGAVIAGQVRMGAAETAGQPTPAAPVVQRRAARNG